jgi:hypothetical protein
MSLPELSPRLDAIDLELGELRLLSSRSPDYVVSVGLREAIDKIEGGVAIARRIAAGTWTPEG